MNHSLFVSTLFLVTLVLLAGEVPAQYSSQTQSSGINDEFGGVFSSELPPARLSQESMLDSHYVPVSGKLVGVWPDVWSLERLTELRLIYGFSGVLIGPSLQHYGNAIQAGFSPSAIMVHTWDENYIYAVDSISVGMYYIDEPVEHDCYGHTGGSHLYSPQELADRRDYVHQNRPGAKFVISGYKRCSHNLIASTYADVVMYSSYKNWDELSSLPPICHVNIGWGDEYERPWLPGSEDQRDSWTAMQNTYGAKYSMTWVRGEGDEYYDLFAHANTLGLEDLWLFIGSFPIDSARLESFCDAAWQNGWLNKVPGDPLPIQLSSFTAKAMSQSTVLLEWETLTEVNNYGFEIQKSPGQPNNYQTIPHSFVPGHGTTNVPHQYIYTDTTASTGTWFYRLKQVDLDGTVHYSDGILVDVLTDVEESPLPTTYSLDQNYPNPFNPSTTIEFALPNGGYVSLKVFNVLGKEVATLVSRELPTGRYGAHLDAADLPSGTYFYRLQAGDFVDTKKLLLLK